VLPIRRSQCVTHQVNLGTGRRTREEDSAGRRDKLSLAGHNQAAGVGGFGSVCDGRSDDHQAFGENAEREPVDEQDG
jgi:hypothetical protein